MTDKSRKENSAEISFMEIEPPSWCSDAGGIVLKALDLFGMSNWEVSVLFCNDDFIADLNGKYRSKPEPTDVLSFSQHEDNDFPPPVIPDDENGTDSSAAFIAGDIVISIPALERNAAGAGIGNDEELVRLLVHGILHLSGMDHEEEGSTMLEIQDDIIRKMAGG